MLKPMLLLLPLLLKSQRSNVKPQQCGNMENPPRLVPGGFFNIRRNH